ncbi:ErpC protein [Borreliella burgdorferi]|uniref:ErpC protein n=1 Tax=Borreliella burgdorferi TaxID=139 RepID=UPI000D024E8A|nr:ErpC protein [Borreliella burgdorferi]PRR06904.1 ErpC protein [Borreliella burgdorferi]
MNKKTFIICAVFALISSCKNFTTSKDLKQNPEGKIKGFLVNNNILDPTKDKIASSGSKVNEVAKKLQEEELMQGDDPNNGVINPPSVLSESGQDNAPVSTGKAEEQGGGQQEQKAKEAESKGEEEKVEGKKEKQDSEKGKVEEKKEKQENAEGNTKGKEVIEQQKKQQEETAKKAKAQKEKREREQKIQQKQEEQQRRAKEEEEQQRRAKEEEEQQRRTKEEEEQQRRAKEEEERQRRAKEEEERQRRAKEEEEKRQVDAQIKRLTSKIDEINGDIDVIKDRVSVGAEEVRDKITGPVYDYFVDGENSIRKTWGGGDLEEDDEDSDLGKLLKELSDTRDGLRTKLNEGNKPHTGDKEPKLKTSVNVSDIKGDLEKLKSYLEKVKGYLENKDNFEDIKGYIEDSNLY